MPRYVNTVPQGVAGTGNAGIYNNPVAAQFGNQLAQLRQNEYNDELLRQKKAEDLAKTFRDNQLAASEGRLWAGDVGKLEQDHIQKGIDLKQRGIDPYGVSQPALEYQKERRAVQAQQGYRKATETQFNELDKLITANPSKYRPEDIQGVHDFFNNTRLNDAYTKNLSLPQLRERFNEAELFHKNYNPVSETKEALPVADVNSPTGFSVTAKNQVIVPQTLDQIQTVIEGTPGGVEYVKETTGITPKEAKDIPNTFEANVEDIKKSLDNDPSKKILANQGIVWGTPEANSFIESQAAKQYQAKRNYNSFMNKQLSVATSKLNASESIKPYSKPRDPNEMTEYQRQSLALRRKAQDGSGGVQLTDRPLPLGQNNPNGQQAVVYGKNGVSFTTPVMNMVGAKIIDANTGSQFASADSSSDIAIAGLIQAPILNKDITLTKNGKKTTLKAGSVVQKNYADNNPENVYYKKVGVAQKPRTGGKFSTVYVDASSIPQNGLSKKAQGIYDAFMSQPDYVAPQKTTTVKATTSVNSAPKKGQTMPVQGGTAIFDGTKWVMKK